MEISVGVALSIIGCICTFFYFVGGHLIKRHFELQDKAERVRFKNLDDKIEDLGNEIYRLRSSLKKIEESVIIMNADLKVIGRDIVAQKNDVNRLGRTFLDYGRKMNDKFSKIETEFLTILKGGGNGA